MQPRPRRDLKRGGKAGGSAPRRPLTSTVSRRGVRYRMLNEVAPSRSRREPRRRWFSDDDFDLVVWFSDSGSIDRKSTRLNSSHGYISYAVFCLKKKKKNNNYNKKLQ